MIENLNKFEERIFNTFRFLNKKSVFISNIEEQITHYSHNNSLRFVLIKNFIYINERSYFKKGFFPFIILDIIYCCFLYFIFKILILKSKIKLEIKL